MSRLTSALGGYGDIAYDYNLGGDRMQSTWVRDEGGASVTNTEDYTYNAAFQLDNIAGTSGVLRSFTYAASGQVQTDDRNINGASQIYAYTNNNRGRPTLVTKDGVIIANYTYDDDEQRIVKSLPDTGAGATLIHYHYDGQGRLIAETDGTTGETLREYMWLGLTPIATVAANDNVVCTEQERMDELAALIADKTGRITAKQDHIIVLAGLIADKTTRIATKQARITELEALVIDKQSRIAAKQARIEELGALIIDKQARIADKQTKITTLQTRISELQVILAGVDPSDTVRIADLTARIAAKQLAVQNHTTRIGELEVLITAHQTRIGELETRITELTARIGVHETRIAALETRNAELAALIVAHQTRTSELEDRITILQTRITAHESELATLTAACEAAGGTAGGGNGGGTNTAEIFYLHTDHLGKPQFATDTAGSVVWDGGITTPFGESIATAAAFTQQLMFPGQYQDTETGLSHNHHRTYDPTLGRYLQSDPIGLAGGLNRYAYVGGNPVSLVDPTGEIVFLIYPAVFLASYFASDTFFRQKRQNDQQGIPFWCNQQPGIIAKNGLTGALRVWELGSGVRAFSGFLKLRKLRLSPNRTRSRLADTSGRRTLENQVRGDLKSLVGSFLADRALQIQALNDLIATPIASNSCRCNPQSNDPPQLRGSSQF